MYKATDKSFKKAYGRTSKKRKFAMTEVIKQNFFSLYQKCKRKKNNNGTEKKRNASKLRYAEPDGTYRRSNGIMKTLMELETVR